MKIELNDTLSISHIIGLVPFCSNDDPTRLQMANSQMRQSLHIKDLQTPYVCTGYENLENYGTVRAHSDCKRKFSDNNIIIIEYTKNGVIKYETIYLIDYWIDTKKDNWKKGEVIAYHSSLHDMKYIKYGYNASVAFMNWFGYNMEDAIVVSESYAKKNAAIYYDTIKFIIPSEFMPVTLDKNSMKPLPVPGDIYQKYDPICKLIKTNTLSNVLKSNRVIRAPMDLEIIDIKIFPNSWHSGFWDNYVRSQIIMNDKTIRENKDIRSLLYDNLYYKSTFVGDFKFDGKPFDGILVEIKIKYEKPLQVGDKLANRHGNKGVISKILPDDEMPKTKSGLPIEVILNPLGGISRMNIGQIFEQNVGKLVHMIRLSNLTKVQIFDILEFIYTKDNDIYKSYVHKYNELDDNILRDNFTLYDIPFKKYFNYDKLKSLIIKVNKMVNNIDLDPNDEDSIFSESVIYKDKEIHHISTGHIYMMRLVHNAADKMKSTHSEEVNIKFRQPINGQKIGEMEHWCFMAYDAINNIREIDIKSDAIEEKERFLSNIIIDNDNRLESVHQTKKHTLKMVENLLRVIGIEL